MGLEFLSKTALSIVHNMSPAVGRGSAVIRLIISPLIMASVSQSSSSSELSHLTHQGPLPSGEKLPANFNMFFIVRLTISQLSYFKSRIATLANPLIHQSLIK